MTEPATRSQSPATNKLGPNARPQKRSSAPVNSPASITCTSRYPTTVSLTVFLSQSLDKSLLADAACICCSGHTPRLQQLIRLVANTGQCTHRQGCNKGLQAERQTALLGWRTVACTSTQIVPHPICDHQPCQGGVQTGTTLGCIACGSVPKQCIK